MKKLIVLLLLSLSFINGVVAQTITRKESVQSLYIELFNDTLLTGTATGFVIKSKTQNFLITNWHVVTNKNPVTKEWLYPDFQITPNRIRITHNAKKLGNYTLRNEWLIDPKSNITYKEFTTSKEMVDVVAIPLKDTLGDIMFYPVDYLKDADSLLLQPTDRLFVLGFPRGIMSAPYLPIWKSGLIASEPDIAQENKPIIWLDIESFPGMSGSPVYFISDKLIFKNGDSVNLIGGYESFFMGVFSHGKNINVGSLWKSSYLKKIFQTLP